MDKKPTFKERADVAVRCLPEAPYRTQLQRLFKEMLDRITDLEFYEKNHGCLMCRGDIGRCDYKD